jgi:hypothetical protein
MPTPAKKGRFCWGVGSFIVFSLAMSVQAQTPDAENVAAIFSIPPVTVKNSPTTAKMELWSYVSSDQCAVIISHTVISTDTSALADYPGVRLFGSISRIGIQVSDIHASETQDSLGNYRVMLNKGSPILGWEMEYTVKQHGWEEPYTAHSLSKMDNPTYIEIAVSGSIPDAELRADRIVKWLSGEKDSCDGRKGYIDPQALFTKLELEIPKIHLPPTDSEIGMTIEEIRSEISQGLTTFGTDVPSSGAGVVPDGEDTVTLLEGDDLATLKNYLDARPSLLAPNSPHFGACTLWLHHLFEDSTHTTSYVTQVPAADIVDPAIQTSKSKPHKATIKRMAAAPDFSYIAQDGMRHQSVDVARTETVTFRNETAANEFLKQLYYLKRKCVVSSSTSP